VADVYKGDVYIAPLGTEPGEGGWTNIGETADGVLLDVVGEHIEPLVPVRWPVSLTITVDYSGFSAELERLIHRLDQLMFPRKHRRCRTCHPRSVSRPLAVNGHEYHRRQRARTRRKR
jgi:hypothetical protein